MTSELRQPFSRGARAPRWWVTPTQHVFNFCFCEGGSNPQPQCVVLKCVLGKFSSTWARVVRRPCCFLPVLFISPEWITFFGAFSCSVISSLQALIKSSEKCDRISNSCLHYVSLLMSYFNKEPCFFITAGQVCRTLERERDGGRKRRSSGCFWSHFSL